MLAKGEQDPPPWIALGDLFRSTHSLTSCWPPWGLERCAGPGPMLPGSSQLCHRSAEQGRGPQCAKGLAEGPFRPSLLLVSLGCPRICWGPGKEGHRVASRLALGKDSGPFSRTGPFLSPSSVSPQGRGHLGLQREARARPAGRRCSRARGRAGVASCEEQASPGSCQPLGAGSSLLFNAF